MTTSRPRLTKTLPPQTDTAYPRARLFRQLDKALPHKLIWLTAQAGSGKTSLVASYLAARELPVLWYQLDAGDEDMASFFYFLARAGRGVCGDDLELPHLTPEYQQSITVFSLNFFRTLFAALPTPAVLVFDNYQDVAEQAPLHDILPKAFAEAPDGITIIVLSRAEPPADYSRLKLHGHMQQLGWDELRLTADEISDIYQLRYGKTLPAADIETIAQWTGGWMAALTLLLEHDAGLGQLGKNQAMDSGLLFDYFASEIFRQADAEIQTFLLQTALLPKFTLAMAEQLTGQTRTAAILDKLLRSNYFIYCTHETTKHFEYHQLFRDFLLTRLTQWYGADQCADWQDRAAAILAAAGDPDSALTLWQGTGNRRQVAELITQLAPELLSQGRSQLLLHWFDGLSEQDLGHMPWLLYWRASALLPLDVMASRDGFIQAYAAFARQADLHGQALAWAGIVDTYIYAWGDFRSLDSWLDEFDKTLAPQVDLLPAELRTRMVYGIFCALMYCQPQHPQLAKWQQDLYQILIATEDTATRIALGTHLVFYDIWWSGDLARATLLWQSLHAMQDSERLPPLLRIVWHAIEAAYLWVVGANRQSLQSAQAGLALAESTGVHMWDVMLLGQGVWASMTDGDTTMAKQLLQQMQAKIVPSRLLDVSHFYYQSYLLAWRERDTVLMRHYAGEAVRLAEQAGVSMLEGYARIGLGWALRDNGDEAGACEQLIQARRIGQAIHSQAMEYCCLLPAVIFQLHKGSVPEDMHGWQDALHLASRQGFVNHPWWQADRMSRLCARALDENVETDFIRRMIRLRGLKPPAGDDLLTNWPWPIRVYCLGRFSILVDGQPVQFSGKTQKKPLELLKALIAFGGRKVSEEKLAEALWPDAEGDVARNSLHTTLHRLRKLLGTDVMLARQGGRLTLNADKVWVDVWLVERLINQVALGMEQPEPGLADIRHKTGQLLHLYQGPFLGRDEETPWSLSLREHLRSRVLRVVRKLIVACRQQGLGDQAIELYEKALQVDDLAEDLYRGLMQCYAAQGNRAEALAVYGRCANLLHNLLGIGVSAETEALHRALLEEDPPERPATLT